MNQNRLEAEIPDPVENRRSKSGRVVRLIYGTSITLIMIFLLWNFGRFLIFLEGSGTITGKKYVLSAPYTLEIASLVVMPGTRVKKGEIIAQVKSFQVQQYISDLLRALVEQTNKEAEYKIRLSISQATRETSKKRLDIANENVARIEASSTNSASLIYKTDVYRERANATVAEAQSNAEANEIANQLTMLDQNRVLLEQQIAAIKKDFNDGKIIAPVDGIVTARIAESGTTLTAGGTIMELYDTSLLYIEWEMPLRRLVEPQVGDPVYITSGYSVIEGSISDIFPISTNAGSDRSLFTPIVQGQTARVKNHGFDELLALDSHVMVRMNYSHYTNKIFNLFKPSFRQ